MHWELHTIYNKGYTDFIYIIITSSSSLHRVYTGCDKATIANHLNFVSARHK